jgi:hypothetical protein
MTSWRFHLFIGSLITGLFIYFCLQTELRYLFISEGQINYFYWYQVGFVGLLGSLIPDFDFRKTKIRHFLGLVIGFFLIISYLYLRRNELDTVNPVSLMFALLVFIIVTFLIGISIPFRHHGFLHSVVAAILYALVWCAIEILVFDLSILQAGLVGIFGFIGYISHLVMDWQLKWT